MQLLVAAAYTEHERHTQEALQRVIKELETVKKQLANAISDKESAGTRAQQTQAQLQADLQKANEKVS